MLEGEIRDHKQVNEGEIYATLVANPRYWKAGHPKIRKISFIQLSPKTAIQALLEGQVDLVTALIPKDTLRVAESRHAKGKRVTKPPVQG
jgi:ABC-type transport system substrate-binding protein